MRINPSNKYPFKDRLLFKPLLGLLLMFFQLYFLLRTASVLNNRTLLPDSLYQTIFFLALWAFFSLLFVLLLRLPGRHMLRPLPLMGFLLAVVLSSLIFYGKGLLYTDDGLWLSVSNLPYFLILLPIMAITCWQGIQLLISWRPLLYKTTPPRYIPGHTLILVLLQLGLLTVYFVAYQPGNMSYDTYNQWSQILGNIPYTTWHPIAHTFTMEFLLWIRNDLSIIALAQILLYIFVTTQFAYVLMKEGVRPWVFYSLLPIMAAMPNVGINLMTLWKDIPFTIGLLWATLILYKMLTRQDYFSSPMQWVEFFLCMSVVGLYRYNGLLAFAFCILFALLYLRDKVRGIKIKGLASIVATLTLFTFVMGPLPGLVEADPNPAGMKLRPIFQGLGAMYKADKEENLPADMRLQMEEFADPQEWRDHYDAYFSDIYIHYIPEIIQKFSTVPTTSALQAYVQTGLRQPDVILGDRFNLSLLSWSAVADPYGYNNRFTTIIEPDIIEEFHVIRLENPLADFINEKSYETTHSLISPTGASQRQVSPDPTGKPKPVLDAFLWRVGFYEVFLALVAVFALYGTRRALWLYGPLVGNWLLVFLTMPAQDYRYVWFVFVLCPFLTLSVLSLSRKEGVPNE